MLIPWDSGKVAADRFREPIGNSCGEFLISQSYSDSVNFLQNSSETGRPWCTRATRRPKIPGTVGPALEIKWPRKNKHQNETTTKELQSDDGWNEHHKVKHSNLTLPQQVRLLVVSFPRFFQPLSLLKVGKVLEPIYPTKLIE